MPSKPGRTTFAPTPACCPVCGHALRVVLTPGGLRRICTVCGEVV